MSGFFNYKFDKKEWLIEAECCLDYALSKLQSEYRNIKINKIIKQKILNDYYKYCEIFYNSYIKGNLDSFEKSACLMTAIHKNKILFYGDKQFVDAGKILFQKSPEEIGFIDGGQLKAQLALDAALKMCENPICYVGENCDEEKQLEKFNLSQFIENYKDEWQDLKLELLVSSRYSEGKYSETLYKYLMLKYLYKYVNSKINGDNIELNIEQSPVLKKVKEKKFADK